MDSTGYTERLKKEYKICIYTFVAGLLITAVTFLPYLADYYVLQPNDTILTYYADNSVDIYYHFETIMIGLSIMTLWFLSKRLWVALTIPSLLLMLLAYADSIKYTALHELLRFNDLMVTEAAGIALRYLNLQFSLPQLKVLAFVFALCVGGFAADRLCRKYPLFSQNDPLLLKRRHILRLTLCCVCLAGLLGYSAYIIGNAYSMTSIDTNNVYGADSQRYIVYNFIKNDRLTNINMNNVQDSYRYFLDRQTVNDQTDAANKPNVIVIMNESWWNTDNITGSGITFSSDPMETYRELEKYCSSGQLTANIFCGGTIGSETEFLTGLNTKYFVSYMGIALALQEHKIPSIVDYFNALDYDTVAIHPYEGSFYGRSAIYPALGFDKIVFEDDMDYTDIYSCYISDESLARQIIKEYEESKAEQKFIYAVSIANHIQGLDRKHDSLKAYPYPISVKVEGTLAEEDYMDLVSYINGIHLANEAFEKLAAYFAQTGEPVVLVMYGDHMPGFSEEARKLMGLGSTDPETQRRHYSVPVLIWSNFEADRIELDGENINYLPQILLEYAGLPDADMSRILKQQREFLKTNTRILVADDQGKVLEAYDYRQREAIRHFMVVDYDILYGSGSSRERVWLPYTVKD
ncbi:MAG: LTA synthase family protein [Lachnospiraceae bacterium]|nr:LTA synthase family protein [Lachnospiraceae bacterium]